MSKTKLAIIGGTGLTALDNLEITRRVTVDTPFGEPSSPLAFGHIQNGEAALEAIFIARHGHEHNIPPHKVNYRANLWALREAGVTAILAVNAVGGIRDDMVPGSLVVPDQIIDYTTSRTNTFFEDDLEHVTHIDFSYPYSNELSEMIFKVAEKVNIDLIKGATYAATEGPRLETAAEIQRLKRDGCDLVGMTGMPEAALARELELDYASICVNANWAAGLSDELITMEAIEQNLLSGMEKTRCLIGGFLDALNDKASN
ncbi:MAG: S-methyl-5'-thioinosine phosphorylase [Gammaproteobacteria bacterium]|nr:S-methyl-5'-thioinosine phosphorylase [Gammaproteobacteria bacterium]